MKYLPLINLIFHSLAPSQWLPTERLKTLMFIFNRTPVKVHPGILNMKDDFIIIHRYGNRTQPALC